MGSVVFEETSRGTSAENAFASAKAIATSENGRGYTGSLSEKDYIVIIESKPLPRDEAQNLAYQLIEDCDIRIDDKWGPAGAIRLQDDGKEQLWFFFGWASF